MTDLDKATLDVVEGVIRRRVAERFDVVQFCQSDRSRKHMQIRADEGGQILALIRALKSEADE